MQAPTGPLDIPTPVTVINRDLKLEIENTRLEFRRKSQGDINLDIAIKTLELELGVGMHTCTSTLGD